MTHPSIPSTPVASSLAFPIRLPVPPQGSEEIVVRTPGQPAPPRPFPTPALLVKAQS